jgi:hypothetical protein
VRAFSPHATALRAPHTPMHLERQLGAPHARIAPNTQMGALSAIERN